MSNTEEVQTDGLVELRAERDALLQRPIDLAKMDSIDDDATDRMIAYYWWQQAQDARADLQRSNDAKDEAIELGLDYVADAYNDAPEGSISRANADSASKKMKAALSYSSETSNETNS